MQSGDPLQTRLVRVLGPAAEQLPALLPHLRVGQVRRAADSQALQQGLVRKSSLEARAGILDQTVEQDQSADLAVHVAVLELLADGARGLRGARRLDGDDFDEVGDAADVVFLVGFGRERLDGDRDGGVGLLLEWALAEALERLKELSARAALYVCRTGWNMLGGRGEAQLAVQVGMGKFAACCALDVKMLFLEGMSADRESVCEAEPARSVLQSSFDSSNLESATFAKKLS